MKKLITTCVMLTAVSVMSFAQSKATSKSPVSNKQTAAPATKNAAPVAQNPENVAKMRASQMQAKYNLSSEQTQRASEVELNQAMMENQMKANGQELGAGQKQQMTMTKLQRYQSIMTPDQFAKYKEDTKNAQ